MNEWEWQLLEDRTPTDSLDVGGVAIRKGDRVRLKPRAGGDIFDLALAGKIAIVEAIEQDYEGEYQLAVVVEDDPGREFGMLRQPGHRFFFRAGEVEPAQNGKILVAGIGNIFLGDDGFGVEVLRQLSTRELPPNVVAKDFGIRGYDLAYALLEPYELIILVDASARGQQPGTLYTIEPDLAEGAPALDAHAMNPLSVIQLARSMGTLTSRILVVACEPGDLGGEEGNIGLSGPVAAAIGGAIALIEKLIAGANSSDPTGRKA